jgi:hypothetical protein
MSKKKFFFVIVENLKFKMKFSFSLETIDDEVEHNDENDDDDDDVEKKTELRISQPKYSQLLKDLDFSRTRMVK